MINSGAVIITFNPKIDELTQNLEAVVANFGTSFLVVDNGSSKQNEISSIVYDKGGSIINLKKNLGIATAQNIGFNFFEEKKFDWVMLLDQDSMLPEDTLTKLSILPEIQKSNTGAIGINYDHRPITGVIKIPDLIASGSLIRIEAWNAVNGLDENLFIDYVDLDFDAKLLLAGFELYMNTAIILKHEIGETIRVGIIGKILAIKKKEYSDHSPIRHYYYSRNMIIVKKRYPWYFDGKRDPRLTNIILMRESMLAHKNRFSKVWADFRGTCSAWSYNPKNDVQHKKNLERIKEFKREYNIRTTKK
ncbi:glycosyltransferase [Leuconostoc gasicomitatum]|uniref:glycosyltransferase n=1 Tax=Leuconostoc gasicomitatum TaxID=115778 RepID=UPI000744967B|nr:glycosyltransferase [Leuconostoc gasicomitatum]CUR63289.1 Putative dTDP-rhamnosyl transferase 1 RfbF1 [Leuconostoc gasicomitatum KG16-1]